MKDVTWLVENGTEMLESDWHDDGRQSLAILLDRAGAGRSRCHTTDSTEAGDSFLLLFNAASQDREFRIPAPVSGEAWRLVFDTQDDTSHLQARRSSQGDIYVVQGCSMVLFIDRS